MDPAEPQPFLFGLRSRTFGFLPGWVQGSVPPSKGTLPGRTPGVPRARWDELGPPHCCRAPTWHQTVASVSLLLGHGVSRHCREGTGTGGCTPRPAAGAQRWGYAAAPLPFSVIAAPGCSPRTSASQGINKISSSGTEISLFAAAELQSDAQGAALIQTSHSNPSSGRLLQALAKHSRYGCIPARARSPTPAAAGGGDSAEERRSANEDNALLATHTHPARHRTARRWWLCWGWGCSPVPQPRGAVVQQHCAALAGGG